MWDDGKMSTPFTSLVGSFSDLFLNVVAYLNFNLYGILSFFRVVRELIVFMAAEQRRNTESVKWSNMNCTSDHAKGGKIFSDMKCKYIDQSLKCVSSFICHQPVFLSHIVGPAILSNFYFLSVVLACCVTSLRLPSVPALPSLFTALALFGSPVPPL